MSNPVVKGVGLQMLALLNCGEIVAVIQTLLHFVYCYIIGYI